MGNWNQARGPRRRARRRGLPSTLTYAEWADLLAAAAGRCFHCAEDVGSEALTIDHLVPLSAGGPNELANVVPACRTCNWQRNKDHQRPTRGEAERSDPLMREGAPVVA